MYCTGAKCKITPLTALQYSNFTLEDALIGVFLQRLYVLDPITRVCLSRVKP